MSKGKTKKEITQDEFEAELKSEPQVFDGVAITTLKKPDGGYLIVKIPIDIKNLVAGNIEVISTATSKSEASTKFKINVVKNGVI